MKYLQRNLATRVALAVLIAVTSAVVIPAERDAEALTSFDAELLTLINNHRTNIGRTPFVEYVPLSQAALNWSVTMRDRIPFDTCNHSGFAHDTTANIATQGQPPGTTPAGTGENIACGSGFPGSNFPITWSYGAMPANCASPIDYSSALMQFCQWVDSAPHRQALESATYTQIGLGTTVQNQGSAQKVLSTARFSDAPVLPSKYVAVNPARILDTRNSTQGQYSSPWTGGLTRTVNVTGVGPIPAAGVDAVALNVTTVSPAAQLSWLTISPTGEAPATTAMHNFGIANFTTQIGNDLIIAKVGASGTVDIGNHAASVGLVIDVVGYYTRSAGNGYVPVVPARLLDSRPSSAWGPGETRQFDVTGVGPVPGSGVEAVVLNVTSASPTAPFSWLTISPTGQAASETAALNFGTAAETSEIVTDVVVAKVGASGTIDIRNAHGSVHLVIDVVGYFASTGGDGYKSLNPRRILDTRNATQGAYSTPWTAGLGRTLATTLGTCASAAVLHVTTVNPTAEFSWITATPTGVGPNVTAALTFGRAFYTSEMTNDVVIARTGADGNVTLTNHAGNVDLVVDLVGSYGSC